MFTWNIDLICLIVVSLIDVWCVWFLLHIASSVFKRLGGKFISWMQTFIPYRMFKYYEEKFR